MLRTLWGRESNHSSNDNDDRNAICNDQDNSDDEHATADHSYPQEHCHFLLLSQKEVYFLP